jgi:hypothetical protein
MPLQRRPMQGCGVILLNGVAGFIGEHARGAFKK